MSVFQGLLASRTYARRRSPKKRTDRLQKCPDNTLPALHSRSSEEKRLLEAMLLAAPL